MYMNSQCLVYSLSINAHFINELYQCYNLIFFRYQIIHELCYPIFILSPEKTSRVVLNVVRFIAHINVLVI